MAWQSTERRRRAHRGASLVEVLVAFVVAAIVLALGVPTYGDWVAARDLMNHAQLLAQTLTLARTEAIKHGYRVNVCKSADGRRCANEGRWDIGYLVHLDDDGKGTAGGENAVLRVEGPAHAGVTIAANRPVEDYISYTSLGHARMLSGALQMGTFTVCKPGRDALLVVLANSGRVRLDKSKQRCP